MRGEELNISTPFAPLEHGLAICMAVDISKKNRETGGAFFIFHFSSHRDSSVIFTLQSLL